MTTSSARKQEILSDASVVDYLQTFPDFFERNSGLLAKLRLPHVRDGGHHQLGRTSGRGPAGAQPVSRPQAQRTGRRGTLQRRTGRPHSSPEPALIRAKTLLETINAVETSLREDFDAMNSVLVLFLEEAKPLENAAGRFLRTANSSDEAIKMFESLMTTGKPRCGQVRDTQRDFLFGKDSVAIGSVALTPLGAKGALGLLAIGASDADRFHPAMSTEFLSRIGELVTYALMR